MIPVNELKIITVANGWIVREENPEGRYSLSNKTYVYTTKEELAVGVTSLISSPLDARGVQNDQH